MDHILTRKAKYTNDNDLSFCGDVIVSLIFYPKPQIIINFKTAKKDFLEELFDYITTIPYCDSHKLIIDDFGEDGIEVLYSNLPENSDFLEINFSPKFFPSTLVGNDSTKIDEVNLDIYNLCCTDIKPTVFNPVDLTVEILHLDFDDWRFSSKLAKEKQFNRRVDMNATLRKLKSEFEVAKQ